MKPDGLQAVEGVFTFEQSDKLVDYAKANNLEMRGHTLVWHSQVPDWFFQDKDDPSKLASKELLLERERTHIRTVLNHYKDKYGTAAEGSPIKYWDVVNEVIDDNGEYRDSKWYQIAGLDYIRVAFETAREVDPSLKLYINDYNIERNNAKTNKLYELVKMLKAEGVPIDGVGLQMHVSTDISMESIRASIEKYASIPGIDLQITELDVGMGVQDAAITHEVLLKQARYYKQLFDVFKENKESISAVVIWGVTDDTSWRKENKPLLFNGKYLAKPAFYALVSPENAEINIEEVQAVQGTPKDKDDIMWSTVRSIDINTFFKGVKGATAQAQIMWDENNLYIKAYVKDNTVYNDDTFEIFIENNNKITINRSEAISDENGYLVYKQIPLNGVVAINDVLRIDFRVTDYNVNGSKNSVVVLNDYSNSQDSSTEYYAKLKLSNKSKIEDAIFGTPVIDGKFDGAWDNAKEISTDIWVTGNSGATAKVKTMWDNENLYVIADVTDPVLNKSNENVWEQDSVEIFLDQNNNKTSSYQGDDSQIRVNFENTVTVSGYNPEGLKTQTSITDKGYIVELAIPLTEIEAKDGYIVGFDVQVNDADEAGVRTGVVTWCDPSGSSYASTSGFGNIRFVNNEEAEVPGENPEEPGNPGETPEEPEVPSNPKPETPSNPETPKDNALGKGNENGNLPQTGSPISPIVVTILGISMVAGGVFLNKRKIDK